jgi:hypothetical protein
LSKHLKRILPVVAAVAAPIAVLQACALIPGATTASPTPGATATPSAARVVMTKLAIDPAGQARSITLTNVGGTAADISRYVISYENKAGANDALAMVHARIVGANDATFSLSPGATASFTENVSCQSGNCVKLESTLGMSTGVTKLGIQATHGSVALYKAVPAGEPVASGSMVDYFQYGNLTQDTNSGNYTHAAAAVTAGLWESVTATASAPGAFGTSISVVTAGATGSTNWKKD